MTKRPVSPWCTFALAFVLLAACSSSPGSLRMIRGSVGGLTGTGLVLQLNGGDDLAVPANATGFQFRSLLSEGSPYSVTVLAGPTNPAQTCTVANGAGIAGSTDITDVIVICSADSYAIGGSVAGLLSSGLMLQLNGQTNLSVSSNGTFVFPTRVAASTTYTVTVATEPTNPPETCTVANGTGAVGSADVTNVTVVCSTSAYVVGGSVSGLTGSGLVLQLNGQNGLSVTANGSFAFPTKVASGATYTVSVGTQPTGPTQACSVANEAGTVTTSDITNVAVTCANVALVDGSECTADEQCSSSHCSCATPTCDGAHKKCSSQPCGACRYTTTGASCDGLVNEGTNCSDGNACTTGDHCSGGSCVAAGSLACDDGNPCTDDSCDPATGCVHKNNDTASCSDGNACTTGDHCSGGSCVATGSLACDDGNPCTNDSCNPATGCVHVNNTAPCSDGNACTYGDHCSGGVCVSGTPYTCSPDTCTAAAACDGNGYCTPLAPRNDNATCGTTWCGFSCGCSGGYCDCPPDDC